MDKIVVVYKTKYGSAKHYAEWISNEVNADLFEATEVSLEKLLNYDTIVYGGSLYAVGILGFSIIKNNYEKLRNKKIIVFSVGASPAHPETIEEVKNRNLTAQMKKNIVFFHLRGGFNYSNLSFADKIKMSLLKLKIKLKKEEKRSKDEKGMLVSYDKPADWTNKKSIIPIVDSIKSK